MTISDTTWQQADRMIFHLPGEHLLPLRGCRPGCWWPPGGGEWWGCGELQTQGGSGHHREVREQPHSHSQKVRSLSSQINLNPLYPQSLHRGSALNQALKPPGGRQTPVVGRGGGVPQQNAGDWDKVLHSNRAGAATNAEDFTQEFMSQLRGNTAANLPPAMVNNKVNGQPSQHLQNNNINQVNSHQDQGVRLSTPTQQVSREWRLSEVCDVCVCCVLSCLFIRLLPLYTLTLTTHNHIGSSRQSLLPPNYKLEKTQTRPDFWHLVS